MDRDRLARFSEAFRLGARPATTHAGSKRGFAHKLNPTKRLQRDFIYGQIHADGRMGELASGQKCIPPHIRQREPLEPARPLNSDERAERYARFGRNTLSGPQRRRAGHKLNHAMAKARGGRPEPIKRALAKTPKGTTQPHSGELSRGFRRLLGRLSPQARNRALMSHGYRH